MGRDFTIYSKVDGYKEFETKNNRKFVSVYETERVN